MPTSTSSTAAGTRFNPDRRRFLRGLGVCLAVPALESLGGSGISVASEAGPLAVTSSGAPLRAAFVYFPNGAIPAAWWPKESGNEIELSRTLKPLESVKDTVQVLKGLDQVSGEAGPDGAGDHARGNGTFLTGVRLNKSATNIRAGVSIDQVIAKHVGHLTRLPSLELTGEAKRQTGSCDSGYSCAYQYNLSWSSATTPMTPEANPRLIFERLFGAGAPGERLVNMQRRLEEQRSVLDFVLQDARAMRSRLSPRDKAKLDQYLDGIREVEAGINKAERFSDHRDPNVPTPAGIPAEFEAHVDLLYELTALAFQTDTTRVATLLLAHDGSNRSFDQIGITEGHHELTHHQNRQDWIDKVRDIDLWYAQRFGKFLRRLKEMSDVDGQSLLHNSMIVYGSGNADANRHTHRDLPVVLAGGGGGTLQGGRFVDHDSQSLCNLFVGIAQRMGLTGVTQFGDSTKPLANV